MRWKKRIKKDPEDNEIRVIRKFLFMPKCINDEYRWLEFVRIKQRYLGLKLIETTGNVFGGYWEDIDWGQDYYIQKEINMEYNKETIIGDKMIQLTTEEQQNVTNFHESRIAFAILEDGTIAINNKDPREHRVYLEEDFNVNQERMEKLSRGYIKEGRIVFYRTFHYFSIEEDPMNYIKDLGVIAVQHFGEGTYEIWNGVKIGKPGEEWLPLHSYPYKIHLSLTFSKGRHNLNIRVYQ